MELALESNGTLIAKNAVEANTFFQRAIGLLGRRSMDEFDALIIPKCKSVHMWGMRFAIDVVFCDEKNRIVKVVENLKPWSMTSYVLKAQYVIEIPSGTISNHGIEVTDTIIRC